MKPPLLADWILKIILPQQDSEYLLGDFQEIFIKKMEKNGRLKATIWYWYQVLRNTPGFVKYFFYGRAIMFQNYLKITLRQLVRNWGFSFINITGLSLGLACCILMMVWVGDEFRFNQFHQKKDRLYRIYTDVTLNNGQRNISSSSFFPLAELLARECPDIHNAGRVAVHSGWKISYKGNQFYNDRLIFADPPFLTMFSFPLVRGDGKTAMSNKLSVILTENACKKYFGNENPIGKTLTIKDQYDVQVTGIAKNIPKNSTFQFDLLFPYPLYWGPQWQGKSWGGNPLETYVEITASADLQQAEAKVNQLVKAHAPIPKDIQVAFRLQPFTRLHLYSIQGGGLINSLTIFSLISLFILIIACINFMNLSTAKAANRAKEVGMRKVVGARKSDLTQQFIGESIMLAFIALIFAIILAAIILPIMNNLLNKNLSLQVLLNPGFFLLLIGLTLVTGILAGTYPALILAKFQPIKIFRGGITVGTGRIVFRKFLVVFQFSLAIFLIIGTLVAARQLKLFDTRDLGYNKENILRVVMNSPLKKQYRALKLELLKEPGIARVSRSLQHPAYINSTALVQWPGVSKKERISMNWDVVDYDYFATFDMKILQGRPFSPRFATDKQDALIVNEEAVKLMGLKNPLGSQLKMMNWTGKIIGVVKNFHFQPLKYQIKPFVFKLNPGWTDNLFLRYKPDNFQSTLAYIKKQMEKFNPGYPFQYQLLKDTLERSYGSERKIGRTISYFSIISIFISSLGLFGLASLLTVKRTKEIGIRRTLGASTLGLIFFIARDFLKWVVLANLFAWPMAYLVLNRFLRQYAYRITINLEIYLYAAVIVLMIALGTIAYQTIRASRTDPIDALKSE